MHSLVALLSILAVVVLANDDPIFVIDSAVWNALNGDVATLRGLLTRADGTWREDLLNIQEANSGQSLIMKSVLMGKIEIVEMLVEAGADLSIPEKMGYTVIDGAAFQGSNKSERIVIFIYFICVFFLSYSVTHG
jgi:hypothetical protein